MKRRSLKIVALVGVGGFVCQATSCVGTLVAIAAQNVFTSVFRNIIDSILAALGVDSTTA